ncbi:hypothetical protein E2C01_012381 [Portunus trituberculatus]|uniref:Uncharacterized protein n=1 Tax=Portunus trituberculatus TaxID=210409 RepID=A0A5B7DED8_PORTR|nr:hypothetical protein [Portunus trituberculatus]
MLSAAELKDRRWNILWERAASGAAGRKQLPRREMELGLHLGEHWAPCDCCGGVCTISHLIGPPLLTSPQPSQYTTARHYSAREPTPRYDHPRPVTTSHDKPRPATTSHD